MSTEGWIFMVGFRVFDVGLLIAWLVWFFRLRDDDDPSDDDGPGGGPDRGRDPDSGPGGKGAPVPTGSWRVRDHARPPRSPGDRRPAPARAPVPSRVRLPAVPHPATRRAPSASGAP